MDRAEQMREAAAAVADKAMRAAMDACDSEAVDWLAEVAASIRALPLQSDEVVELRATIARMDATIRFLRDQYRTAAGLPTVPPEGTCPTCGQKVGAP